MSLAYHHDGKHGTPLMIKDKVSDEKLLTEHHFRL